MRQLMAFFQKESMELIRTGKFLILTIIFVLFGVMNPAIAKITPWLIETLAGDLADVGMAVTEVKVDALTSWAQFYKNLPIALIVFVIMFSGILTLEYQKGTLINVLTKGLQRWKVITAKLISAVGLWTICYGICFGITYAYNAFFWDNSVASNLFFAALCVYLIGIWLITVILLMSVLFNSNTAVLTMTGGIFVISYLLGLIPRISRYLPTRLLTSGNLLTGAAKCGDFARAAVITLVLSVCFVLATVLCFNKKRL